MMGERSVGKWSLGGVLSLRVDGSPGKDEAYTEKDRGSYRGGSRLIGGLGYSTSQRALGR